jgi:hypothetical protein
VTCETQIAQNRFTGFVGTLQTTKAKLVESVRWIYQIKNHRMNPVTLLKTTISGINPKKQAESSC